MGIEYSMGFQYFFAMLFLLKKRIKFQTIFFCKQAQLSAAGQEPLVLI